MIKRSPPFPVRFQQSLEEFIHVLAGLEERTRGVEQPAVDGQLFELTAAIRQMSAACLRLEDYLRNPAAIKEAQRRFQERIGPWFDTSWFMQRAKAKPRGYPGDYELLTALYEGQPKSSGLGGYLDLYFIRSELGRAVPARMKATREYLSAQLREREGDVRILNVASGPCREFFTGLEMRNPEQVSVWCVDNDQAALDFVRGQAETFAGPLPRLIYQKYNVLRMMSPKRNLELFGQFDFVYSIGLLDYIPDQHLIPILDGLGAMVKPGGKMFVAFKDALGYDRAEYQWFVDWFFFPRYEPECRELFQRAGFESASVEQSWDETRIILNYEHTATTTKRRVDGPALVRRFGGVEGAAAITRSTLVPDRVVD